MICLILATGIQPFSRRDATGVLEGGKRNVRLDLTCLQISKQSPKVGNNRGSSWGGGDEQIYLKGR